MKIRKAFVANSSSTSFIIEFKEQCSSCSINWEDLLITLLKKDNYLDYNSTEPLKAKMAIKDISKDDWFDPEAQQEQIALLQKAVDEERAVYCFRVSYHSILQDVIDQLSKASIIEILEEQNE